MVSWRRRGGTTAELVHAFGAEYLSEAVGEFFGSVVVEWTGVLCGSPRAVVATMFTHGGYEVEAGYCRGDA